MKKLFALLVVLALCGAANAAVISLVGEGTTITAASGGSVTLLINTTGGLIGLDALVTVTGDGIITAAMNPADATGYGWDGAGFPIPPIGVPGKVVEVGGATFGAPANGNVGYVTVQYNGGNVVVSIAGGTAFGGSMDDGFGAPTFSQGVVTLIPEPMTIALLGLGGLFLRRRK